MFLKDICQIQPPLFSWCCVVSDSLACAASGLQQTLRLGTEVTESRFYLSWAVDGPRRDEYSRPERALVLISMSGASEAAHSGSHRLILDVHYSFLLRGHSDLLLRKQTSTHFLCFFVGKSEKFYRMYITVFLDCLHTKIKSSTLLAKPYTQEAKHQPIFAQL